MRPLTVFRTAVASRPPTCDPNSTCRSATACLEANEPLEKLVEGRQFGLRDSGHGHPYLLLHGGAGPMSFAAVGALLAAHGRVVTPTHPGFAGTARPSEMDSVGALATRYVELLEEVDLVDVCVVGNSLGGWVAAEMAILGSPRASAFVIVDAVGIDVPGHPIPDVASLSPAELAQRAWFDPSKVVDPTTLPPAVQATLRGNGAALAVYGGAMQDPTLLGRLGTITTPTLVAWGKADRIGDVDVASQPA